MPYGSILIVDDVELNLYVAKGLLAPYGLSVDTAMSAFEAVDKIKYGKVYDIVFMDHMMPNMDGIEAAKIMRDLGYTHPIVALTANAVAGQTDIFLANGFDDCIPKPIDIRQLNAVLKKYVRDTQPPEAIHISHRQKGCPGGHAANETPHMSVTPQLAEVFLRDALKAVAALEAIYEKHAVCEDEDILLCTINAHAMKSALANVGESELSAFAAKLEQAGRNKDAAVIVAEIPAFLDGLRTIIAKLASFTKEDERNETAGADFAYLRERLHAAKEACKVYDRKTAKDAIVELRQKTWPRPTGELLATMAEHLLNGDFEELACVADRIIETL